MPADYRVELDIFTGPMDLLLYLVRRNEIDSLELRLAVITQQFLDFLEVLEFIDLELAADFVVIASTLLEIKSRLALPQDEENEEEELPVEEPQGQLIQQLLEYRNLKSAAQALEERAAEWQERYPRLSDERPRQGKDPRRDHIKEVELWDLVSAFSRVIRKKVVEGETRIRYDDTPIAVYAERIRERVTQQGRAAFSDFFEGERLRSRIVGIFLAILELLRHHDYRAEQPVDFGEIWILPPRHPAPDSPPTQPQGPEELTLPEFPESDGR